MLKSKFEKFIAKRLLILFAILTIINMTFNDERWLTFIGLVLGAIFCLLRFEFLVFALSRLLAPYENKSSGILGALNFAITYIFAAIVLGTSAAIHFWTFVGAASGIVLLPLVVIINSITEGLHITHNNFE